MKPFKKAIMKDWWNKNLDYLPLGARWRGKYQQKQVRRMIREIDERKLDIEIAEKVFGHKVEIIEITVYEDYGGQTDYPELGFKMKHTEYLGEDCPKGESWTEEIILPNYSTDLKDAMLIKEKITFPITMTDNISSSEEMLKGAEWEVDFYAGEFKAFGKTLPETICRAALKIYE